MRPGEVLDAHHDLRERVRDEKFATLVDVFGSMEQGRRGGFLDPGVRASATMHELLDEADRARADGAGGVAFPPGKSPVEYVKQMREDGLQLSSDFLKANLDAAETYRVTHDMSMVVEHAANLLNDEDTFDKNLAPSGAGFVSFDKPLPVKDVRGKTMLLHFLVWGPGISPGGRPGTVMHTFNDTYRQPDEQAIETDANILAEDGPEVLASINRVTGRWAADSLTAIQQGQPMGPAVIAPTDQYVEKLAEEHLVAQSGTNVVRYLHALWLLMGQTVARVEEEHVDRPARRRAIKKGFPPKVTVIKLRREANENRQPGESDVEWQHRWVRRGHWRWQVCGERHPLAQDTPKGWRCRIWINPTVCGPADKPFMQSEKLISLER